MQEALGIESCEKKSVWKHIEQYIIPRLSIFHYLNNEAWASFSSFECKGGHHWDRNRQIDTFTEPTVTPSAVLGTGL